MVPLMRRREDPSITISGVTYCLRWFLAGRDQGVKGDDGAAISQVKVSASVSLFRDFGHRSYVICSVIRRRMQGEEPETPTLRYLSQIYQTPHYVWSDTRFPLNSTHTTD